MHAYLQGVNNVHLVEPVNYPEFISLLRLCFFVLTDSGGIQEEALTFKKPVLVMRECTERVEAIEVGAAKLVGTSKEAIVSCAQALLDDPKIYSDMQVENNPFGDGKACERIIDFIKNGAW